MNELDEIRGKIARLLAASRRVLIISHVNPDADAYGSSLALMHGLRALGVEAVCVNENGILQRSRFIPGIESVLTQPPGGEFDAVVACDCGDSKRFGDSLRSQILERHPLINIDHHVSNEGFGDLNLVIPTASSTCELIYGLLRALESCSGRTVITVDAAQCLYCGLSADTGSFRFPSTSAAVFEIAAQLVRLGADPARLAEEMYASDRLQAVRLQAEALTALEIRAAGRVAIVAVSAELLARHGATAEDTEELVDRARSISGVQVAAMMRQEHDYWKVSLRSKDRRHDVAALARTFGGGGHVLAAGFRAKLSEQELRTRLYEVLDKLVQA